MKPVIVEPFMQPVGPKEMLPLTPLGLFRLFFTPAIISYITEQTNLYASQCMTNEVFQWWEKVTDVELEAFFGFMILMGLVHLPSLKHYWRKDSLFHYSPITSRISRNRFLEIQRYLHFVDNSTLELPGSPLYDR